MIYLVTLQTANGAIEKLMRSLRPEVRFVKCTTYERLFRDQQLAVGHFVFGDLDMLTHYEREAVVRMADALRAANPDVHILNDPRAVLERYPLLRTLEREGINRFGITRLDGGDRPPRYPVFIRSEDNHLGVDTELLHDDEEFDAALSDLKSEGKLLKRRVAVEFRAEQSEDGLYRKYGVINVGGELIPQHVLHSEHWLVKRRSRGRTEEDIREDLTFVHENPHRKQIDRIFKLAHIDYGRVDYALVNGEVQVYEINTNPNLPGFKAKDRAEHPARAERRHLTRQRFIDAFSKLNAPLAKHASVSYEVPLARHFLRPWHPLRRRLLMNFLSDYPSVKSIVPRRYW